MQNSLFDKDCKYLQITDVSDSNAGVLGSGEGEYEYYCTLKKKNVIFPYGTKRRCKEFEEVHK